MRRWLPFLLLAAGSGSLISHAQATSVRKFSDPFERYLGTVNTMHRETALQRFASDCGVDLSRVHARYAVSAGGDWNVVKDLRKGLHEVESDFYTTVEVWKAGDHFLSEVWPNSDDVGSEIRVLRCYVNGNLQSAEAIQWNLPVGDNPDLKPWAVSRRWHRNAQGVMLQTHVVFVDEYERVIQKPKLDKEDEESIRWSPPLGSLAEQKYPADLVE